MPTVKSFLWMPPFRYTDSLNHCHDRIFRLFRTAACQYHKQNRKSAILRCRWVLLHSFKLKERPNVLQRVPLKYIASFLGITQVSLIRIRAKKHWFRNPIFKKDQFTNPADRAKSIGIFRLWRDPSYAAGAVMTGVIADFRNLESAIFFIGFLTFISAFIILFRMQRIEKHIGWFNFIDNKKNNNMDGFSLIELKKKMKNNEPVLIIDPRCTAYSIGWT